ncbi:ABC transporter permease [Streptomyces europaeiscabiei]|uniref:ABC transporter permease n=1 Tax=Streptomyces europaeiscabiei TaxID=146819 RepID=A0ABU4NIX5_9ACTN|nr:ABC transporter permease [Streptomyces europaeiscabiei]MDX3545709.1 ABC transporter permease [Streptomyces europaeiscabiei]MDX3554893.1 ABC transporter permease [Streptomyces europaeiscabiei]MDX3702840.1 ABC transporter permease [Streptomyces europaeiscabiei]
MSGALSLPTRRTPPGVFVALVLTLAIGWLVVTVDGGRLFSVPTTVSLLHVAAGLGLVAVGQTLVVVGGSLDLSVAYVVSLSTLVAAETMASDDGALLPAVGLTLAVSATIGLVNGLLVTTARINPFIATVGVGLLLKGYLDNGYDGPAGKTAPALVQGLGYQRIGPVPLSFLLLLAVAAAAWFVLARTRFGHHLIAVGGDPEVARLSGVRGSRVLVTAHVLCALCAGLAGVYLASRLGAGAPRVGTEGLYDLESIAAVVLGGTALAGGRGGVVGTVGGVLLLASIDAIFNQLEVDVFFKQVIRGVIIIAAVAVYARRAMRKAS